MYVQVELRLADGLGRDDTCQVPIPNYPGKHQLRAIFDPADYPGHIAYPFRMTDHRGQISLMPDGAVLLYSNAMLQQILRRYECGRRVIPGFASFYEVKVPGGVIAVLGEFGIGGPAAARTLEEIIAAGVTRAVSIGGAGALDPELRIGDVVICDGALRDEGVSYHYLPPDHRYAYPDGPLTTLLRNAVEERAGKVRLGKTWTTDALYRETREEVRCYRDEGVLTVEMEAASLAAVASCRRVAFATGFAVMDSLAADTWRPDGFDHRDALAGLLLLFEAAAAVLA